MGGFTNQDEIFGIGRGGVPTCLTKDLALSVGFRAMSRSNKCLCMGMGRKYGSSLTNNDETYRVAGESVAACLTKKSWHSPLGSGTCPWATSATPSTYSENI